jgi:heterodisulfide reductase subunit B
MLDIELTVLPDWNCCGSSSVHAVRPQLAVSLAARNLFQAQAIGRDLLVMCAGCLNRLRMAADQLRDDTTTHKVNLEILGHQLDSDLHVYHLSVSTLSIPYPCLKKNFICLIHALKIFGPVQLE